MSSSSASECEWDVLVAGAGMSGLSAALAASQDGCQVLVVERADQPGGQAAISAGAFWAPPTLEAIREYVPDGDAVLQELLVNQLPKDLDWLEASGLLLSDEETLAGFGRGRVMHGGSSGRQSAFMNKMAQLAAAQGVRFTYGAGIISAVRLGKKIQVELDNGEHHYCRSLVLATGGFQGSAALLSQYLNNSDVPYLMLRGLPESIGNGLEVALSLGAGISGDMRTFYGHTMPDMELAVEDLQPLTPYFARYGILVNWDGRRFVDEGSARLEEVNPQEGYRQPGGRYFLLFDRSIYETHGINQGVISAVPSMDRLARLQELGAPIYEAPSIEELAQALQKAEGVNEENLLEEIESYNTACSQKLGHTLHPPRERNGIPLKNGPLYAMRCAPGITNTCGGIRINNVCQVLSTNGGEIPDIFAAGVDAGGIFGRHYAGFLGWALVSGRLSGKAAARSRRERVAAI